MFKIIAAIALTIGLTSTATQANAGARWGEDLRFVANTSIPGTDGTMALCHLVDFMDVLFVPVYTTVNNYALSNSGCTGDMYRDLSAAQFTELQTAGLIPADLPATPAVSPVMRAWGHAWLILGAIGVLKTAYIALRGKKKRKTGTPDMLAIHSLVAMSQVAVADGRIDDAEVHQIASILTRLTGQAYAPSQVMDLLSRLNPSASDLDQIGQDLSEKDRQIVLEAALNIAVADGEIHPNEYAVVSELAQRMRIGADQFRSALARISAHLQSVQTA
ncbi:TerB family tellurite resistance protein [Octadecabacter sp. G9-8]|uniref:TerB family tellurite resistance protein n=1 Tax=Octadecabacter dasysiphoniae TaxID=2909341 RepID=A0ABS9CQR7_9RHOB|nr:TerB family tellurite resistance protein [Octadecabacter dasysiphoniae]MCF2869575.1 TerB family tellurite resistance protein [Octadecabacter dasysiphoniae]